MNQNLRVNKTYFHMKGFALGLALKQRRKPTRKSPITQCCELFRSLNQYSCVFFYKNLTEVSEIRNREIKFPKEKEVVLRIIQRF